MIRRTLKVIKIGLLILFITGIVLGAVGWKTVRYFIDNWDTPIEEIESY